MLDRSMSRDEVEQHSDTPFSGSADQGDHVVIGAVSGRDAQVISNVVTCIAKRRCETRIEPDHINSKPMQVVKVLDNTGEISDPIAVGVCK